MVREKSESAFNEIYDTTEKSVLSYITAKCCNIDDINDIFQETYTELFIIISEKGTDYIKSPIAFVMKIAKQKIYRYYSAKERLKMQISMIQIDKDDKEYNITDLTEPKFSTEENYFAKEQVEEIADFLAEKDLLTRKIFYLFFSQDLTIPEISELLGISQSTVKNRLYRTLNTIKENFQQKEGVKNE